MKTYTKAVSATLASALAVGMVPAMAFAAEGDAELELLVENDDNVVAGSIVAYDIAKQAASTNNVFTAGDTKDGKYTALIPTYVQGEYGDTKYAVTEVVYFKVLNKGDLNAAPAAETLTADGQKFYFDTTAVWAYTPGAATPSLPTAPGKYVAFAYATVDGQPDVLVNAGVCFNIAGKSLSGLSFYEIADNDPTKDDLADVTFTWDGDGYLFGDAKSNLNVKMNGVGLDYGTDYQVQIFDAANNEIASTTPLNAGTYTVYVIGDGDYAGNAPIPMTLTVDKFDLSKAVISVDTDGVIEKGAASPDTVLSIAGLTDFSGNVEVTGYDKAITGVGSYNAIVEVADPTSDWAKNVVNTGKAPFIVVEDASIVPVLKYDGTTIANNAAIELEIVRTAEEPATFDSAKLSVWADGEKLSLADGEYSIKVMKEDANAVGGWAVSSLDAIADAGAWGTFKVSAVINPANLDTYYGFAGETAAMDITTYNGNLVDANVAYTFNNKLVQALNTADNGNAAAPVAGALYYDGTDKMDLIDVAVKVAGKEVSEYEVVIKKNDVVKGWVVVDGIVDAGTYEVSLKSAKYDVQTSSKLNVVVNPAKVTAVVTDQKTDNGKQAFYTGKAIQVVDSFYYVDAQGNKVSIDVPATAYKTSITSWADDKNEIAKDPTGAEAPMTSQIVKYPGLYAFGIADIAADNYNVIGFDEAGLRVTTKTPFVDVPSDAWYAEAVYEAEKVGIVNGIEGTNLFAPTKAVKRGDFVCMLWNLAEAIEDGDGDATGSTSSNLGIGTKSFDDVRETAYYAKPVAWAKQAGIANGHNGQFRPEDSMTREEGIAFIANFADAYGIDVSVLAADVAAELAKYPDGAKVSGWAEECVAWACINDVAGNGATINPKGTITRAEAAAMLVNYKGAFVK